MPACFECKTRLEKETQRYGNMTWGWMRSEEEERKLQKAREENRWSDLQKSEIRFTF